MLQKERLALLDNSLLILFVTNVSKLINTRAETNIRNVTNETFSKRTNIRIFVRFDDNAF